MSDFWSSIGNFLNSGVQALNSGAQALAGAVQTVGDLASKALWRRQDEQDLQEHSLKMSQDVVTVQTQASVLIEVASKDAIQSAKEIEDLMREVRTSGLHDPEITALAGSISHRLAGLNPLSPEPARPGGEGVRPTEVLQNARDTVRLLEELGKHLEQRREESWRRVEAGVIEKLKSRLKEAEQRIRGLEMSLRKLWEDGDKALRARANLVADSVMNYGAWAGVGLAVGLSLGLSGGLLLLTIAGSSVVLGNAFGRNWHFFG